MTPLLLSHKEESRFDKFLLPDHSLARTFQNNAQTIDLTPDVDTFQWSLLVKVALFIGDMLSQSSRLGVDFSNLDSGLQKLVEFQIPKAGFWIPKPKIPDSTSKNFLDSGIRITLHEAKIVVWSML